MKNQTAAVQITIIIFLILQSYTCYAANPKFCPSKGVSTKDIPRRFPTYKEGCGNTTATFKRIVGGETSQKGAWPWIALLGYDDDSEYPFRCGGTLITSRHVLTAAHCISSDLVCIRLGAHDLSIANEPNHLDVRVLKTVNNVNFKEESGRGDIALVVMERNIPFTSYIYPICMPSSTELRTKSFIGHTPFVAGWGALEEDGDFPTLLQQVQIMVFENKICLEAYKKEVPTLTEKDFDAALICAGMLIGGKDACEGDSGGPLMLPLPYENEVRFHLIGVVSYGFGCAEEELPAAYTSTQYFMNWIEEKIRIS